MSTGICRFILRVTPLADLSTGGKDSPCLKSKVMKVMMRELRERGRKAWGHWRRQDGCPPP